MKKDMILPNTDKIYYIRGKWIMLDKDLADFYQKEVRELNQQKNRNLKKLETEVFQLTEEEYLEVLAVRGEPRSHKIKHRPTVYTRKAAFKMAFFVNSDIAEKMADVVLEVFMAVQDRVYTPDVINNKVISLENRMDKLEKDMTGRTINNFNAQVNLIQGNHNQVNITSPENIIEVLAEFFKDKEVLHNKEVLSLLNKSMELANKKDKKGVLENLKSALSVGSNITSLSKNLPFLIDQIQKLIF